MPHDYKLLPLGVLTCIIFAQAIPASGRDPWVVYEGKEGPARGQHLVFVTGDDEYRSEEGMPMLAQLLSVRHGFKCTVLFAIDPADGTIKPDYQNNIPGLHLLADADMMVMFLRFRQLPDGQMKQIIDFANSGKPMMGLRTSTHPFNYKADSPSPYAKYTFNSKDPTGGFGQLVFGDTWINHHGKHRAESTRGVVNDAHANHPILRGVHDVWGPSDVYGVVHLPKDARVLLHGQVLAGMQPASPPVDGPKNDPLMPLVWLRDYQGETGNTAKVICTTMGASQDLQSEDLRRLLVNACYWALGLEDQISANADVRYVKEYEPTGFGFRTYTKGLRPDDFDL